MDRSSAAHPDKRTANPQSDILLDSHYCRCLRTVVHYAGSRRPNLRSNGADLRLRANRLSDRNFYGYARFGLLPLPEHVREAETLAVRSIRRIYSPVLQWSLTYRKTLVAIGAAFLTVVAFVAMQLGSEFLPHLEEGNLWIRASMPPTIGLEAGEPAASKMREILLRHPEIITVVSQHGRPDDGSDASP